MVNPRQEYLLDEISKKVAEKLGMNDHTVKMINRYQWKKVYESIKEGDDRGVSIMYVGKFVKKRKPNYVINRDL